VADPAGMIRFERRLKTDISIVELPSGQGPGRAHPQLPGNVAGRRQDRQAVPGVLHHPRRRRRRSDDPKAKSAAVARIAPLLRLVPDRIVQSHYVDLTAGQLRISDRRLVLQQVRPTRAPLWAAGGSRSRPGRRQGSTRRRT
jgi:hypothetical protein